MERVCPWLANHGRILWSWTSSNAALEVKSGPLYCPWAPESARTPWQCPSISIQTSAQTRHRRPGRGHPWAHTQTTEQLEATKTSEASSRECRGFARGLRKLRCCRTSSSSKQVRRPSLRVLVPVWPLQQGCKHVKSSPRLLSVESFRIGSPQTQESRAQRAYLPAES